DPHDRHSVLTQRIIATTTLPTIWRTNSPSWNAQADDLPVLPGQTSPSQPILARHSPGRSTQQRSPQPPKVIPTDSSASKPKQRPSGSARILSGSFNGARYRRRKWRSCRSRQRNFIGSRWKGSGSGNRRSS
ncbi:hypothetical protein B0T21DRAFT_77948, partial [Apiosordaria backusii]